jgi:hypothetical protein
MNNEPQWAIACGYKNHVDDGGDDYEIYGVSLDWKSNRRIFCRLKGVIAHYLLQMDNGLKPVIPIEPKSENKNYWRVDIARIDDTPPSVNMPCATKSTRPMHANQLSFVQPVTNEERKKKQSFLLDESYISEAIAIANKLGISKAEFYKQAIQSSIDLDRKMKQVCF